jgi:hypothetical protein
VQWSGLVRQQVKDEASGAAAVTEACHSLLGHNGLGCELGLQMPQLASIHVGVWVNPRCRALMLPLVPHLGTRGGEAGAGRRVGVRRVGADHENR